MSGTQIRILEKTTFTVTAAALAATQTIEYPRATNVPVASYDELVALFRVHSFTGAAGAALAGSQSFDGRRTCFAMAMVGGPLLGAAQLAGLIILLVGVLADDDRIASGSTAVRLLPRISGSFAGASLEVDL